MEQENVALASKEVENTFLFMRLLPELRCMIYRDLLSTKYTKHPLTHDDELEDGLV